MERGGSSRGTSFLGRSSRGGSCRVPPDDTFRKNPWLKVVNSGYLDTGVWNPIETLVHTNDPWMAELVVCILESLTPIPGNEFHNDIYLTVVNDHTGKMCCKIEYKIFDDAKWQGKIVPGVALILTKVVL